jgi:hypothetical protein
MVIKKFPFLGLAALCSGMAISLSASAKAIELAWDVGEFLARINPAMVAWAGFSREGMWD